MNISNALTLTGNTTSQYSQGYRQLCSHRHGTKILCPLQQLPIAASSSEPAEHCGAGMTGKARAGAKPAQDARLVCIYSRGILLYNIFTLVSETTGLHYPVASESNVKMC